MTNVRNKNSEINVGHRNVFVGFLCQFSYAQVHTPVSEDDMRAATVIYTAFLVRVVMLMVTMLKAHEKYSI